MATTSPPLIRARAAGVPAAHAVLGDAALAGLVRRGDAAAFEALYRRHREPLQRYAMSLLRRREDAEEALQEAMLRAYRALQAGDCAATPRAWLFRIVRNVCLDAIRARREWCEISCVEEDRRPGVHHQAELRDDLERLSGDLAALPPLQRSALVLRELCGLSHADIGVALGTPADHAKQLIYEARQRLHAFDEARQAPCEDIRRRLSDGDGRVLGSIRVTAHLRGCKPCRTFEGAIAARRPKLAALFPALPALASKGVLELIAGSVAVTALPPVATKTAALVVASIAAGVVWAPSAPIERPTPHVPAGAAVAVRQVAAPGSQPHPGQPASAALLPSPSRTRAARTLVLRLPPPQRTQQAAVSPVPTPVAPAPEAVPVAIAQPPAVARPTPVTADVRPTPPPDATRTPAPAPAPAPVREEVVAVSPTDPAVGATEPSEPAPTSDVAPPPPPPSPSPAPTAESSETTAVPAVRPTR